MSRPSALIARGLAGPLCALLLAMSWSSPAPAHPYGLYVGATTRSDAPATAQMTGARAVRLTSAMNGGDPSFRAYLDAVARCRHHIQQRRSR
jgi:hypothetical protein